MSCCIAIERHLHMLIPLSPIDYYFLRKPLWKTQFILLFDGRIDETRLRESLHETLPHFPALRSGLEILSRTEAAFKVSAAPALEDVPLRVLRLGEDFDLDQEGGLAQFGGPPPTVAGESLFQMTLAHSGTRSILSISLAHVVGDGYSMCRFLVALSDVFHGKPVTAPSNERSVLSADLPPDRRPVDLDRLFRETGYVRPIPPEPVGSRLERFLLSVSEVEALKKEANAQERGLTENRVIMAELFRRSYPAIPLYRDRLIVRCPVDYRKIHPGLSALPDDYFGNAFRDAVTTFDPETISAFSLEEIAARISHAINGTDAEAVHANLACLQDLRREDGLEGIEEVGCPGLQITNLSGMPIHLMDYGGGLPTGMIVPSLSSTHAAILPNPHGLEICLQIPPS
jgi:hypothetical protein